jgi:AcrR family transcriptional regulator
MNPAVRAAAITRKPTTADSGDEANRRAALVRASARLFRDKGFAATTVRDIAGAVGMRSGSPFYHFANKQEILKAVMEEGLRQGLERTHAAIEGSATPRERFRALVRTHYRILHDEGSDFIAVMLHDWRSLPPRYKREIVKLKDRYDNLWEATLAELIAGGLIGANPSSRRTAAEDLKTARLMIFGAINFSATWYKPGLAGAGAMDVDALAERTVRFFLKDA